MSNSENSNNTELSGALSSLNIGSNNEERETTNIDTDNINSATICACCDREGDGDSMNTCNKCDLVKYCNVSCKKKHRSKHKKKCERRVAELYDEELFKEHPPGEECPICFLPLPFALLDNEQVSPVVFESCCGNKICKGCIYALKEREGVDGLCPFCRVPFAKSVEEELKRVKKLIKKGNADAYYMLAGCYSQGRMGMPRDMAKANELLLKAGELGCVEAYVNLGNVYDIGRIVEVDEEKAKQYKKYLELAAMNGNVGARNALGYMEVQAGNTHRSVKHFILAARAGDDEALDKVKEGFMDGIVTKEEYAQALRAYQNRRDEMKSDMRDKARAFCNGQS